MIPALACLVTLMQSDAVAAAATVPELGRERKDKVATIVVRPKAGEFQAGDPVEVEAVLANDGDRALWVNRRLLFNGEFAPAPYRELWLSVVGPDGQQRRFECKVRAAEARAGDYAVLRPGEKVVSSLRLDPCFDLQQKGGYTVTAFYADGNRQVPPAPDGAQHLAATLRSGEVTVRIR